MNKNSILEVKMEEKKNEYLWLFSREEYPCNYACILIKITYPSFAFSVGLMSLKLHHV